MLSPLRVLVVVLFLLPLCAAGEEWQEISGDQRRLKKPMVPPPAIAPEDDIVESGIYVAGEGEITGAFGILFDEKLPLDSIITDLGWQNLSKLPAGLSYRGTVKPFNLPTCTIKPPAIPSVLRSKNVEYQVFLDFDDKPIWIVARMVPEIDKVILLLRRKYGEPVFQTETDMKFIKGSNQIRVSKQGSVGEINYLAFDSFNEYLEIRNRHLRKKYANPDRHLLNPEEMRIMVLTDEFMKLRQNLNRGFGINFDKRVGFLARPDQLVTFTPPEPMRGFEDGTYKIMVNPDLKPVSLRIEVEGTRPALTKQKWIVDHALDIAFGGFLKHTERHTVLSLQGNSISVLVRKDKLILSVIDSSENNKYNQRLKARQLEEELAIREQKRLVAMKKRQKEIDQEKGL